MVDRANAGHASFAFESRERIAFDELPSLATGRVEDDVRAFMLLRDNRVLLMNPRVMIVK